MAMYHCKIEGIATGAVANTFKTVLALKLADTLGHVATLRKLIVGGGGGAPLDKQVSLRLRKSNLDGDGTSTAVNVNTIGKSRETQIASRIAAIGKNFTVEPTTFGTETYGGGAINDRGGLVLDLFGDEGITWGKGETLCLEAAPGEATAVNLEAYLCWEE